MVAGRTGLTIYQAGPVAITRPIVLKAGFKSDYVVKSNVRPDRVGVYPLSFE
jgi:hypothetical protein